MNQDSMSDPIGPTIIENARVVRGGTWFRPAKFCRSATRAGNLPIRTTQETGIRLVRSSSISTIKNVELEHAFTLKQNYPNPVNPSTTIKYNIKKPSNVTLSVYDLYGRKVSTLVNSEMSPGFHSVEFNATKLPSGSYIYRLESEVAVLSKIMTVIK
jgi:hypothetical protein